VGIRTAIAPRKRRNVQEGPIWDFNTLRTGNLNHPGDRHF
jgi:hypothetical protein